jgi:uncharacterized membrane protein YhhN
MKNRWISIIYFITGITCIILQENNSFYSGFIAKALIIPVLMVFLLVNLKLRESRSHFLMLAALIFSWAGDIFLDLPASGGSYFVPGLGCFLFAHVMYMVVFFSMPGSNIVTGKGRWQLLPVICYGIVLVAVLYPGLGSMRLPVILYAMVILAMLSGSLNRKEKVSKRSYLLVLAGAVLFVLSDSAIAINKFAWHFEASGIVVMTTYIAAQYLIISGYIIQFRDKQPDQIRL